MPPMHDQAGVEVGAGAEEKTIIEIGEAKTRIEVEAGAQVEINFFACVSIALGTLSYHFRLLLKYR